MTDEQKKTDDDHYAIAFPGETEHGDACEVMVPVIGLRDYFAAAALPSMIRRMALSGMGDEFAERANCEQIELAATGSYQLADAMLKARGER